ncbi:MAG: hypothetical protein AAFZ17_00710 [Cyanobacteria bacterium J06650_10]
MREAHFYGDWKIQVAEVDAIWQHHFTINGSKDDRGYTGESSLEVSKVSGEHWSIVLWRSHPVLSPKELCGIRRLVSYTVQDGLVVRLRAHDYFPEGAILGNSQGFELVCTYLDPEISPPEPTGTFLGFIIPESIVMSE